MDGARVLAACGHDAAFGSMQEGHSARHLWMFETGIVSVPKVSALGCSHRSMQRQVGSSQARQGRVAGKMLSFWQFGSILISIFCALSDFPFLSPTAETVSGSVSEKQEKKHNPIENPST